MVHKGRAVEARCRAQRCLGRLLWAAVVFAAACPVDASAQGVLGENPDHHLLLPIQPSTQAPPAVSLQAAASHRVRVVYLVPSNRTPQQDSEKIIQRYMLRLQSLLRENLARLGYADRTFALELEGGVPKVHVVRSADPDTSFHDSDYVGRWVRILNGVNRAGFATFARGEALLVFAEIHRMLPDATIDPATDFVGGAAATDGHSGVAVVTGDFLARLPEDYLVDDRPYSGLIIPGVGPFPLVEGVSFPFFEGSTLSSTSSSAQGAVAHELGHAFGLPHDFRNDENFNGNLMGNGLRGYRAFFHPNRYPLDDVRLSSGSARSLNFSAFFSETDLADSTSPSVQITSQGTLTPTAGLLRVRVRATDDISLGGLVLLRNGEAVGDISVRGRIADTTIDTYGYTAGVADQWEVIAVDGSGNRAVSPAVTLTATTGVDHAPIPNIRVGSRRVAAGDNVLLDATRAFDPDGASTLNIEWDLDGDGIFDTPRSTNRTLTTSFARTGTYQVMAWITDVAGGSAISMPIGIRVVPPIVNDHVVFEQSTAATFSPDGTGCPTGYAGRFAFDAVLTNTGLQLLSELAVEIAGITTANLLLTGDELLWGGQSFSVVDDQGSAKATMMPGESVTVPIAVCLERKAPFQLFVNVRGTAHD